jgi:hypothetical protein
MFQDLMNTCDKLRWEFATRSLSVNFLDIQVSILPNGRIDTELYEKPDNLNLYLPAHSTHPKGSLKGLVYGSVFRILRLTSSTSKRSQAITNLFHRLVARGYNKHLLRDAVTAAYSKINSTNEQIITVEETPTADTNDDDEERRIFFHITYHPMDPPSNAIQNCFRNELLAPHGLTPLPRMLNHKKNHVGINRLIVAYHRPPNLGNLLSPRLMKAENGPLVSSYIG